MTLKIQKLRDIRSEISVKMVAFGTSGSGKTTFASTAPKPLFLISEVQGILSISRSNPDASVYIIKDFDQLEGALREIKKTPLTEFETVIYDSLTDLNRIVIDHVRTQYAKTKDERVEEGVGDISKPDLTLSTRQWGIVRALMVRTLMALRNLPHHVILIALDVATEEEMPSEKVRISHRPLIQPQKMASELGSYVNLVGYCHRDNGQYLVRFGQTPSIPAKTFQGLAEVEPQDAAAIIAKVKGHLTGAPEATK